MTVHKSQGSEFETVHLVLPDWPAPVLNRSLLYTGVTRARSKLVLWYREPILRFALGQRVERHTGLAAAISAALLPPPAQTLP
jgi:exodeoxyribonuclease V alpha subunit